MRRLELIDDDDFRERREQRAQLEQALLRFLGKAQLLEGADSAMAALQGILERLAAGPAQVLMVTLEDLWLEREPQNVPGTGDDWENWRRKARYSMEEFTSNQDVLGTLNMIHRARQMGT
jgi:4-alpha-glucanotransferase